MINSEGMAGVALSSLVSVTLHMISLPKSGSYPIMGIDQFFDIGCTATNVTGNFTATAAVAQWERGP